MTTNKYELDPTCKAIVDTLSQLETPCISSSAAPPHADWMEPVERKYASVYYSKGIKVLLNTLEGLDVCLGHIYKAFVLCNESTSNLANPLLGVLREYYACIQLEPCAPRIRLSIKGHYNFDDPDTGKLENRCPVLFENIFIHNELYKALSGYADLTIFELTIVRISKLGITFKTNIETNPGRYLKYIKDENN